MTCPLNCLGGPGPRYVEKKNCKLYNVHVKCGFIIAMSGSSVIGVSGVQFGLKSTRPEQ